MRELIDVQAETALGPAGRARRRRMYRTLLVAVLAAGAALAAAPDAGAKTFKPTRFDDPVPDKCKADDCSLREAVAAANQREGKDEIVLRSGRVYELEGGTLVSDRSDRGLTLRSSGDGRARIDGRGVFRILTTQSPARLIGLDLSGGMLADVNGDGGAILANATLTVEDSIVHDNAARRGGGIAATGPLRLVHTTIAANLADDSGGGVSLGSGRSEIVRSRIVDNEADGGGGLSMRTTRAVRIERSTIAGNSASSEGGGVRTVGTFELSASTISGNQAAEGGGIANLDTASTSITNSTVAENRATSLGGGIFHDGDGPVKLNAATIVGNEASNDAGVAFGGGLAQTFDAEGSYVLRNTLIDENSAPAGPDCFPGVKSRGHNLIGQTTGCPGFDIGGSDVSPIFDAGLGELGDHGGPTETVPIRKDSLARGRASRKTAPSRDQRGVKRDLKPDIGAFER